MFRWSDTEHIGGFSREPPLEFWDEPTDTPAFHPVSSRLERLEARWLSVRFREDKDGASASWGSDG